MFYIYVKKKQWRVLTVFWRTEKKKTLDDDKWKPVFGRKGKKENENW